MSQSVLDHFYIYTSFTHSGGEGMPQRMAAEMGEQYCCIWILTQLGIIAVPDNSADGFVQCSKMLGTAISVDKDKIGVTVDGNFTLDPK